MLTVAPLAAGQARYYLALTASAYYTQAPEPEGLWYGPGAEEFGLKGTVKPDDLTRLCEGYDPQDPARHVRNAGQTDGPRARKHGDDLCFSAPKSLSVAWALAAPELRQAIQDKLHRAVRDALDYIQDTCGYARVGAKGQERAPVPLTFALFEHASSRLGDPQLHVHAVCPNLTMHPGKDGKIRVTALDSTEFYHHMMAAGALFRAALAEGMRELGFGIERDGFAFRLKGIDETLCERFSQRRAEIVAAILKHVAPGRELRDIDARQVLRAASGRTAELANLETRHGKEEYTREELFPAWQEIARSLGIEQGHVERLRHAPWPLTENQKCLAKEDLFRECLAKMSDEFSHFSEKDLIRRVAEEAQGRGIHARDVRELIEQKTSRQEEVLRLGELVTGRRNQDQNSFRERSEARYTTDEILKMEGLMLASVERMARKSAAIDPMIAERAIVSKRHLSEEQKNAVRHLTAAPEACRIACMSGKAGSGKSTTLDTCRLAWERAGHEVLGCALAGVAADGLRRAAGIESDTLARTLMRLEHGKLALTRNHVVVLDEAGMVATKPMAELIRHVEHAGAKLVLVGDAAQLQAIGAGGPFRSIAERVGQCELSQIRRQREEWRRQAVEQFSRGEAREALTTYAAREQLHVAETREEAIRGLVGRWKADGGLQTPQDVLLLASLNAEVRAINRHCQQERLRAGYLGDQKLAVGGENIHERDRVLLTKRDRRLGVENGFMGEVVSIDHAMAALRVRLDRDGRCVSLRLDDYGAKNLRLGYASTVHKAQGRTVAHCHVLMGGPMTDRHLGYVQASRCRESTHLFIDREHAGPGLSDAIRALARDRSKDLASDLLEQAQRRALEQQALQQPPRHRL